ncbi:nischarin-like [Centruroides vittatus]|uniref:nischarin-like n=1 Tax=Centruroides vittatus TaxID=120091 RepID=UPI00351042FE
MAVYKITGKEKAEEICQIVKTEQGEGFTLYEIEVTLQTFHWRVNHRYSEFRELHDKLTSQFGIDKNLLPPKKLFGNQSEVFIKCRQMDLQLYLQKLLQQFKVIPYLLAEFLHFPKYEIHGITESLAEKLFYEGDQILANNKEFTMTPLQLYALSERLKLAEPTCWSGSKSRDLGHLLDFISQLKYLRIVGSDEFVFNSNIIPNKLKFDLTAFKSLNKLKIECCNLEHHVTGIEVIRQTVSTLTVHNSIQDINSLLLASFLHWSPLTNSKNWPTWQKVGNADFSHNRMTKINPAIKLLCVVEQLNLSYNKIREIENLESLPRLSTLNLSHNQIHKLEMLHTRLGNVCHLNLSKNNITSLQGMSRLYSLVELDVSNNNILELDEISHVGGLPCLETLILSNNPVTTAVDYRSHVLLAFGSRVSELSLDGQKASQKELDTVAVMQALKAAKEGRILQQTNQNTHGEKATGILASGTSQQCF